MGFTSGSDNGIPIVFKTVPFTLWNLINGVRYLWKYQQCTQLGLAEVAQPLSNGLIEGWSVYSQYNNVSYFEYTCETIGLVKDLNEGNITNSDFGKYK
ncbi:hypothetical protein HK100_004860 [Physocladia obscura]|uniref:Uncharacterized protein n=1 Tax=Physocladia obscura TaxID=109957 RepID=A0AAD5XCQ8_9FUNG|nr:hypothetical protein HK100_004860 [Physocladia obscura]